MAAAGIGSGAFHVLRKWPVGQSPLPNSTRPTDTPNLPCTNQTMQATRAVGLGLGLRRSAVQTGRNGVLVGSRFYCQVD